MIAFRKSENMYENIIELDFQPLFGNKMADYEIQSNFENCKSGIFMLLENQLA